MQGDPKVDELMRPVLVAIERHVKDREAATEIYNRAYEAVMNSMDAKSGKTYCAYCGAEYPLDDSAAAQVSEHIKTCNKHPMRVIEAALARAEARAEAAEAQLAAANDLVHEQDVVYVSHYRTVQEIRKATEELFDFIEGHADRAFLAHAKALMEFRARIMPPDFPNRAAVDAHRARVGGAS